MLNDHIVTYFKKSFNVSNNPSFRGVGIECEIPIVTEQGEAVSLSIIQNMFTYLAEIGFEIEHDKYSNLIVSAKKKNITSSNGFTYCTDTITTDTGYSTIEIVLAPQVNLHTIQSQFKKLLSILIPYFKNKNCLMLGYGIQPLSAPSLKLLMPMERYRFFEKFSTNHIIPKSEGADSSFLNITASNQCHIQIDLKDAIPATNILNMFSGLLIALHANSPIWEGKVDTNYKSNREVLWDLSFPDRLNQIGIPPTFENIENYVDYLFDFKPLLVKRDERYFQIINKDTFRDYLSNKVPTIGRNLNNDETLIEPQLDDIEQLIPFSWFNARLVPKYGTIESRMCCQQPPNETLTSTALTLGIIENLQVAQDFAKTLNYSLTTWRKIRKEAAQHSFNASIDGVSIIPLIHQLLDIANEGLKKRNLQEEVFLQPLYDRLEQRKSPADLAIKIFKDQGMDAFLESVSFKKESQDSLKPQKVVELV